VKPHALAGRSDPVPPGLERLARIRFDLADVREIGATPQGERHVAAVAGGGFDGDRLSGDVLSGGLEWHLAQPDGLSGIETRCTLRTYDGVLISLTVSSVQHARGRSAERLAAGQTVFPHEYYLRAVCRFETGDPRYAWLARGLAVGSGARSRLRAVYDVYSVT
jgi:hypothetical protein